MAIVSGYHIGCNFYTNSVLCFDMLKAGGLTELGYDLKEWEARTQDLMDQGAHIIALRGAGKVYGIEYRADLPIAYRLESRIRRYIDNGAPVALMYDGDEDIRDRTDVGAIFGDVAERLRCTVGFTAIAAQSQGYYARQAPGGGPLRSATRRATYETYVFPDDLVGGHATLTQSKMLATYPGYEQVIVGPAGPITFSQLQDLNAKSAGRKQEDGPIRVTIIATYNSADIGKDLEQQLASADTEELRAKISTRLAQRADRPFGALFTRYRQFDLDESQYPGLAFSVERIAM